MKPRFRREHGVWSCVSVRRLWSTTFQQWTCGLRIGYGYTPAQAWEEWQAEAA
jgi:hypothetical protein